MTYQDLIAKLERRFGVRDLPETSQAEFQYARQASGEDLVDWADRVAHLATLAFPDLPDHFIEQQCVFRFCQGCRNKEAGQFALCMRPSSLEKAVDRVKWSHLVYGNQAESKRPSVRRLEYDTDWDEEVEVRQVTPRRGQYTPPNGSRYYTSGGNLSRQDRPRQGVSDVGTRVTVASTGTTAGDSNGKNTRVSSSVSPEMAPSTKANIDRDESLERRVDSMENKISELCNSMSKLQTSLDALSTVVIRNSVSPNPVSASSARSPVRCFKCQQQGHYSRNCPHNSPKIVSFVERDPNLGGLESKADLQPS